MKIGILLAFFVIGLGPVIAGDPPGYQRALIGRVSHLVAEGVVVDGINESQLHLIMPFPPGVDHECFAGVGGSTLVRGLRARYQVGQKIEIMVTLSDDVYLLAVDPAHPVQLHTCNAASESLAFPIKVDWDPSAPASKPALVATPSVEPASGLTTPTLAKPSAPAPDLSSGSIDDPIPGAHK